MRGRLSSSRSGFASARSSSRCCGRPSRRRCSTRRPSPATSSCRTGPSSGRPASRWRRRCRPRWRDGEVVELGCGLGVPSLVAAARGAEVTAVDWSPEARRPPARERRPQRARAHGCGRRLALVRGRLRPRARRGRALRGAQRRAAARAAAATSARGLLAEPGRPHAAAFLERGPRRWRVEPAAERVYRLTRA